MSMTDAAMTTGEVVQLVFNPNMCASLFPISFPTTAALLPVVRARGRSAGTSMTPGSAGEEVEVGPPHPKQGALATPPLLPVHSRG